MPKKEVKAQPKLSPEQKKERRRVKHLEQLESLRNKRGETEQEFIDRYGPNGKMYEVPGKADYDEITIEPPADMDPVEVSVVVIGSCMREEWLDRVMTNSGFPMGSMTYAEFNQMFLVDNVFRGDARIGDFPPVLIEGRQQAKDAIEAYKNGDRTGVIRMVDQFIRYTVSTVKSVYIGSAQDAIMSGSGAEYNEQRAALLIAERLLEKEPYKSECRISEIDRAKLRAFTHHAEALKDATEAKIGLMKEPPAPNTKEREDQVAEFLFNEYVAGIMRDARSERDDMNTRMATELYEKYGMVPGSSDYSRFMLLSDSISRVVIGTEYNIQRNKISDLEAILAMPDGREKLRGLYMDKIRGTAHYQKLVSAQGNDLKDALLEVETKFPKSFVSFTDIKTGGEADAMNQEMQPQFDEERARIEARCETILEGIAMERSRIPDLTAVGTAQLAKTAKTIRSDFNNLIPAEGVKEQMLAEIRTGLDELVQEADALNARNKKGNVNTNDAQTYLTQIGKMNSVIDRYFETHSNAPEDQAEKAVYFGMLRMKRSITGHRNGVSMAVKRMECGAGMDRLLSSGNPITAEGIAPLIRSMQESLEMERYGADADKKQLLDKAVSATGRLGELVSKEGELTPEESVEAKNLVRDVFGFRLYTKMVSEVRDTSTPMVLLLPDALDRIPEFTAATETLTKEQLLRFAVGNKSDEIIGLPQNLVNLHKGDPGFQRKETLNNIFKDAQNNWGKSVGDQIRETVRTRKEARREAERQETRRRENEKYMERVRILSTEYKSVENTFHKFYGSKPDMVEGIHLHQEYNAMTIDIPEGMDENTVTAIVLGSIMQSERLVHRSTSSSFADKNTTFLEFNRNFLIDNILSENSDVSRQGSIPLALVEGRRKALEAIEEFKAGKTEKARSMVETFIDFGVDTLKMLLPVASTDLYRVKDGAVAPNKFVVQLTGEMIGKPPLNAGENVPAADQARCKNFEQNMKSVFDVYEAKYDVLSKPAEPGSEARAKQIEELMFREYLVSTAEVADTEKNKMMESELDRILLEHGYHQKLDWPGYRDTREELNNLVAPLRQAYIRTHQTAHEFLAGSAEGIETLKRLYLPEIRKTELYQNLLAADGEEFQHLLKTLDDEAFKGLQQFKDVEVGDPAAAFNAENEASFRLRKAEIAGQAEENIRMSYRLRFMEDGQPEPDNFGTELSTLREAFSDFDFGEEEIPFAGKDRIQEFKKAYLKLEKKAGVLGGGTAPGWEDALEYKELSEAVEESARNMIRNADFAQTSEKGKYLIMMCRRVQDLLPAGREVLLAPLIQKRRDQEIENQKKITDPENVQRFRNAHQNGEPDPTDQLYAGISREAMSQMHKINRMNLEAQKLGASQIRKKMIDDAVKASRALSKMILKGEDHIREHMDDAKKYMRDVMAERVLARFDGLNIPLFEPEKYARGFVDRIPEFKKTLGSLTIGKIGSYVYDHAADKELNKWKKAELTEAIDKDYTAEMDKEILQIRNMEEGRAKAPGPQEAKAPGEKAPEEKAPGEQKPKSMEELVDQVPLIEIRLFSDTIVKNPPAPDPLERNEAPQDAPQNGMREVPQEVPPQDLVDPAQVERFSKAVHVFNYSRKRFVATLEQMKQNFMNLQKRPQGMSDEDFRQYQLDHFGANGDRKFQAVEKALDTCLNTLKDRNRSPREMWDSMTAFRKASAVYTKDNGGFSLFRGEETKNRVKMTKSAITTMRVMQSAFETAVGPMTSPDFKYGDISGRRSLTTSFQTIVDTCLAAEAKGREQYQMRPMSRREVADEFTNVVQLAKGKVHLKSDLEKMTTSQMADELHVEDRNKLLRNDASTTTIYDIAADCLVRGYIDLASATRDPRQLARMRQEVKRGDFGDRVENLTIDPIFRQVAKMNPDRCYTRWKTIERKAMNIREDAKATIDGFAKQSGYAGLPGYIAYGGGEMHDPAAPGQVITRNARFARVLADSILKDPKFVTLQRALASGSLQHADVVIEAMDFIERKNIRILDRNNNIRRDFVEKLANGTFVKNLVSSQTKILNNAKNRDQQRRDEVSRQFNLRKRPVLHKPVL